MADPQDTILRMYEGAIRALDTKAQIFLAVLTITVSPLAARLSEAHLPLWARALQAAFFCAATLLFILCLLPRSGRPGTGMLFDSARTPEEVAAHVSRTDFGVDYAASIGVLHGIYLAKRRRMRAGVVLVGIYVTALSAALVLP
ncbi:hypothetical protein P2H44_22435 [Albimonas sp. CAU 1670]|uniref:hypothetical protein n=1 Tax=Albimonas sp. CAU 1670 TaxID=3032599 RepID=UPI0023DCA410|nr:hypothetical protein [Albimonas sp. CAU 1670]MDF2235326.1 hypothetical protein [Albimonas sp. CAU 1670]